METLTIAIIAIVSISLRVWVSSWLGIRKGFC